MRNSHGVLTNQISCGGDQPFLETKAEEVFLVSPADMLCCPVIKLLLGLSR